MASRSSSQPTNQTVSGKKPKKSKAVKVVTTKSRIMFPKKDPNEKSLVSVECDDVNCSECKVYVQKTEEPYVPYTTLLQKIISERNILLFKNIGIVIIGFLASFINFTRLVDFPLKQLYLENVFAGLTYYLCFETLPDTFVLLLGGRFLWYIAFTTKSKELTILLMTLLQYKSFGFRCYGCFSAMMHLLATCVVSTYATVHKGHYVSSMINCLMFAYFNHLFHNLVFCLEDVCYLFVLIVLAVYYTLTEDLIHCLADESFGMTIMFILIKHFRVFYYTY